MITGRDRQYDRDRLMAIGPLAARGPPGVYPGPRNGGFATVADQLLRDAGQQMRLPTAALAERQQVLGAIHEATFDYCGTETLPLGS